MCLAGWRIGFWKLLFLAGGGSVGVDVAELDGLAAHVQQVFGPGAFFFGFGLGLWFGFDAGFGFGSAVFAIVFQRFAVFGQ